MSELTPAQALQLVHDMDTDDTGGNANKLYVNKMIALLKGLSFASVSELVKPASTNVNTIMSQWDAGMSAKNCDATVACTIPFTNTNTEASPVYLGASIFIYGGYYDNTDNYLSLAWNDEQRSSGISAINTAGQRVTLSTNGVTKNVNGSYTISASYRNCTDFWAMLYRNFTVDDKTVTASMFLPFNPFVRGTWRKPCNIEP